MDSKDYWVSSPIMTVAVSVDEKDIITRAAPVVRRFMGQPLRNLTSWLRKHGPVAAVPIGHGPHEESSPSDN
jgi:hypothetical protein